MSDQKQDSDQQQQQVPPSTTPQPEQVQAIQAATDESVTIDISPKQEPRQTGREPSRFNEAMGKFRQGLLERHIRYDPLSIVFALVILIGGILGFALKGSVPSLVSGIIFAILLGIGTYIEGVRKNPYPLLVVLVILGGMMTYRYYETEKFIPTGLFATLTLIMVARHGYLIYLRNQKS